VGLVCWIRHSVGSNRSRIAPPRVSGYCADFNDYDEAGSLPLICKGSLESTAGGTEPLRDGEKVWLSDGDVWVEASVHRCPDAVYEATGECRFLERKPET